jgi:hypothetical protein
LAVLVWLFGDDQFLHDLILLRPRYLRTTRRIKHAAAIVAIIKLATPPPIPQWPDDELLEPVPAEDEVTETVNERLRTPASVVALAVIVALPTAVGVNIPKLVIEPEPAVTAQVTTGTPLMGSPNWLSLPAVKAKELRFITDPAAAVTATPLHTDGNERAFIPVSQVCAMRS